MATDKSFVDYVVELANLGSRLTYKKMFGEYGLYLDDKVIAFACDNSLFIKPSVASDKLVPDVPQRPPYPGAKLYPVIDELLDEPELLRQLFLASAKVLPVGKAKKVKRQTK